MRGRKVCILDDVVSIGGTITTLERLVKKAGGEVICNAAIWVEGPWYTGDLIYLDELRSSLNHRDVSILVEIKKLYYINSF